MKRFKEDASFRTTRGFVFKYFTSETRKYVHKESLYEHVSVIFDQYGTCSVEKEKIKR